MGSKSIVDRVLLVAAAICAAGLFWQLSVLLTSRGHAPASRKAEAAMTSSVAPAVAPQPNAEAPQTVRVVYPDASATKTSLKAADPATAQPAPTPAAPASTAVSAPTGSTPDGAGAGQVDPSPVKAAQNAPAPSHAAPVQSPAPDQTPSADTIPTASVPAQGGQPPASTPALAQPAPADPVPAAASLPSQRPSTEPAVTAAAAAPAETAPSSLPTALALAQPSAMADTQSRPQPPRETKQGSSGTMNINSASVEALNHLQGGGRIGQAIANHRPYRSIEDLVKKRVLRRDVYEQIRKQIATE